jgi:endoglucanase
MHHFEALNKEPLANKAKFLSIWEQLAKHYKNYPDSVYFEMLNEPCDKLTDSIWNGLMSETLKVIRATNPKRAVIVGPTDYNSVRKLNKLVLPNDQNLILTFHFYEPFHFTHQGAGWVSNSNQWLGTKWDTIPSDEEFVKKLFDLAKTFSVKNQVPVYLGEYGSFSKADEISRVQWTSYVGHLAQEFGFSRAYWEYCSGFGIYNKKTKAWEQNLTNAVLAK